MKKLLSKLFFVSDGARGMLFALTLVTLGNYLWFSFFMMLSLCLGQIYPAAWWTFVAVAALTTLYALATVVCAVTQLVKILRRERIFKVLWYLFPAGLCLAVGAVGFVRMFPPLYAIYCWCGSGSSGAFRAVQGLPGVAPEYWAAIFLFALVLLFAGGLLLTKAFAAAEKKKFRSAFGAATLTLYGVFVAWYLVTLGLALHASRETAAVSAAVERRFGRPLTAAGIEALYRENGRADAAFWTQVEKLGDALPKVAVEKGKAALAGIRLPDRPSAETLAWYGRRCAENRAAIEMYESRFDRVPPLPEKRFVPGNLFAMELPELSRCRSFVGQLESSRLIHFLAAKDIAGAWACYRRMGNVGAMLEKEPLLIGSLVWIAVESQRLNAVEKMLESRLLTDDKLDELDADLAALERAIPGNHRQAMYSEAAFASDAIRGVEDGIIDLGGNKRQCARPGAFAPYRWIFPQYWFHAELDKKNLLRIYLLPDLTRAETIVGNRLFFMSMMLVPPLNVIGDRFYELTARVRGMRALIRAEKYRRRHGAFPKTLADLPEDPFTGRPLIYEVGKTKIAETVWDPKSSLATVAAVDAEVVQVHGAPEKLRSKSLRNPENGTDKTRAVIRLR